MKKTKRRKELWGNLVKAWDEGRRACRLHHARQYVAAYPDDWTGWIALADVLWGLALFEESRQALRTSLKFCPREHVSRVFEQFGHMYKEKCDLKKAEKWYRKAVEEQPRQENLIFLGACLAKQGRFQEAKSFHQQAVEAKPETADEAYYNLGLVNRAEGNYGAALDWFCKAIEIDPEYERAISDRQDVQELITMLTKSR